MHHALILIWILNCLKGLNSLYNALMHSTGSCLCLGLTNILPSSISNSCVYAFLPYHSVLQCHHMIKANHSIKTCNKLVVQFYQPSHYFMYIGVQLFTTLLLNTLNLCPSLNMTDQDCNINKQQVKPHITFLNHYVCLQETER